MSNDTPPPHDSMEEAQMAADRWWPQEAEPVTVCVSSERIAAPPHDAIDDGWKRTALKFHVEVGALQARLNAWVKAATETGMLLADDVGMPRATASAASVPLDEVPFMVLYDDADRRPEVVIGQAVARERFRRISDNWNAHLFVKVASNSRDDPYAQKNAKIVGGAS